mmetsp:Transcript_67708/g.162522  ORF Transcript_67708/g.162522 Transcript_67708/m.162522 type:complete len:253 (-) Transcript_67708:1759-2517(-)
MSRLSGTLSYSISFHSSSSRSSTSSSVGTTATPPACLCRGGMPTGGADGLSSGTESSSLLGGPSLLSYCGFESSSEAAACCAESKSCLRFSCSLSFFLRSLAELGMSYISSNSSSKSFMASSSSTTTPPGLVSSSEAAALAAAALPLPFPFLPLPLLLPLLLGALPLPLPFALAFALAAAAISGVTTLSSATSAGRTASTCSSNCFFSFAESWLPPTAIFWKPSFVEIASMTCVTLWALRLQLAMFTSAMAS